MSYLGSWLSEQYPGILKDRETFADYHETLGKAVGHLVLKHREVLTRKYKQSVYVDDYGNLNKQSWFSEAGQFVDSVLLLGEVSVDWLDGPLMMNFPKALERSDQARRVSENNRDYFNKADNKAGLDYEELKVFPQLYAETFNFDGEWWTTKLKAEFKGLPEHRFFAKGYILKKENLIHMVTALLEDYFKCERDGKSVFYEGQETKPAEVGAFVGDTAIRSGLEYEKYCAECLRNLGWSVQPTKGSGDQGVDLIGKLNGLRIVFQCKFYSSPVGNSAVQQAISGRTFEQADACAVITNSSYTKSAKQLAQIAGVPLLHHEELEQYTSTLLSIGDKGTVANQP